jgi:hypothetical protein
MAQQPNRKPTKADLDKLMQNLPDRAPLIKPEFVREDVEGIHVKYYHQENQLNVIKVYPDIKEAERVVIFVGATLGLCKDRRATDEWLDKCGFPNRVDRWPSTST